MSEKKKDIVKYDNQLRYVNLNKLKSVELDILMILFSDLYTKKSLTTEIPFDEMKKETNNIRVMSDKAFENYLVALHSKFLHLQLHVREGRVLKMMTLFKQFDIDEGDKIIRAYLNDCFANYFFDIPDGIGFSQFKLQHLVVLKSKYAKALFMMLQKNFTGTWIVDFQWLKEELGFPNSYKTSYILDTLERCIVDIKENTYIDNISYETTHKQRRGRPIDKIIFRYDLNKTKLMELQGQTNIYDHMHEEQMAIDVSAEVKDIKPQSTELLGDYEYDEPIVGVAPQSAAAAQPVQQEEERCPKCAGRVEIAKRIKDGVLFKRCENNRHSKLSPNKFCMWTETIK